MITCSDCHAVVNEAHEECPVCGGLLHATEEQRAVARVAETERTRAAARDAAEAVARKDRRDAEHGSRLARFAGHVVDGLDEIL